MGEIVDLFVNKKPMSETIAVKINGLEYWRIRNEVISDEFHKYGVYEKQEILDTILGMNYELYKLVLELKGEI